MFPLGRLALIGHMRDHAKTTEATNAFPVVAVGASAGGLEAFSEFLRAIPNNTGMAFVFIQHLDPKHHSILSELLGKSSHMPVLEATNRTVVKPNHVYVKIGWQLGNRI
jgi:two-component system CheB/CheR fusion protein